MAVNQKRRQKALEKKKSKRKAIKAARHSLSKTLSISRDIALAAGSPDLSLDLSEVRTADSKLVACLILVHKDAYDGRASVNVTASDTVQDLVGIYKLDRLLEDKR